MKKTIPNKAQFELDKQKRPLDGEVSVKDARIRAAFFAAQEKMLIKKRQ
ncbi:hypothetical protein ACSV5M_19215 [Cellvibrio sp. ARAG 10.3]